MKEWLYWHFPIITTRWRRNRYAQTVSESQTKMLDKFNKRYTWMLIRPVVYSLHELRINTWDKDRVNQAIQWLRDNFEVKDDN